MRALALFPALLFLGAPGHAGETITYTYDARGRLIKVVRSGTVNDGIGSCYAYDNADNRLSVTTGTNLECSSENPSVTFSISSNGPVTEGTNSVFTVTKTGTATTSVSVTYATANGTAVAPGDYAANANTLTFTTAQNSKTVSVTTVDDSTVESSETFLMTLSAPTGGAVLGTATATATIINDDAGACSGVNFGTSSNGAVTEGTNSIMMVYKNGTSSSSCTVNYSTASGTATAGSDYTATSGTSTFTSTQTVKAVSVPTINDSLVESSETYTFTLSNPSNGADIGPFGSATGTINDNDTGNSPPTTQPDSIQVICKATATVNVTANDSDPEGNTPLTVTSVVVNSGDAHAAVYSASTIQVTGAMGKETATATYTVKDSLNASSTGTLTIKSIGSFAQCDY